MIFKKLLTWDPIVNDMGNKFVFTPSPPVSLTFVCFSGSLYVFLIMGFFHGPHLKYFNIDKDHWIVYSKIMENTIADNNMLCFACIGFNEFFLTLFHPPTPSSHSFKCPFWGNLFTRGSTQREALATQNLDSFNVFQNQHND